MDTSDRILRAIRNPRLFARGINRAYHCRAGLRSENPEGVAIFEEDWDTLVVLDACRYDMFKEVADISGDLSSRTSKGSATVEWLSANFDGKDLSDTVYVTANPQLERNRRNWNISIHETINVWLDEGWDEETGTVLAETITEAAIKAHEKFPHKRLVVHYMQPHYPFVPSDTSFDKNHLNQIDGADGSPDGENVWGKKFTGQLSISQNELWDIYLKNLEYVIKHVKFLLTFITGKIVITSDHGNYVGERASPIPFKEYGHPRGIYDDVLVQVPWLVKENGPRRKIRRSDTESAAGTVKSDIIDERLHNLGYK